MLHMFYPENGLPKMLDPDTLNARYIIMDIPGIQLGTCECREVKLQELTMRLSRAPVASSLAP